ncbi:DegV family protein [Peribacillus psychrosaccharolyticus]|uniref:DegV family protein n=1 Tax=Peribacillus psychrosaccharolyticus TaxID=1407 RepID=A0A974NML5_PERPY|nr:DegV family protein [Peribacillus psychrosaccharolyticus]MEC2056534.1 DegV family protein [Peribacillus psychrosaccharolyticus]MED3745666.1 DegV family protein [Peribacillus psychrosaccharolyticus]QQT00323.1 DegV family protein [Peribacillus psychrosaccharolyticus]
MRKIILSTESGADLPEDLVEKHQIQVVPMHVIMDSKDYLDGQLSVEEVFDYYSRTKKIPSTTATNVYEYHELFTKIRVNFPDSIIIHIGYTSKASASFQSALIAAEDFEDLFLIDTLNVTGGLAAIVMYAVTMLEEEPSISHVHLIEKIESVVPKTKLAFIPGSLDFLRAGGRVSNVAYIGGSLLKVKPCIELKEGKLVSTKKYRGNMSMVAEKLMRDYLNQYDIDRKQLYLIYSIGLDESIKRRMDEITKETGFENVTWMQAGAMISTHAGPGGFGIAGLEY